jgi:hypothetical protein
MGLTFIETSKSAKSNSVLILFRLRKYMIILSTAVLFFNSSCSSDKHPIDNKLSYIYLDSLSERNIISDNINNCRFVKLETTDECLIKWIDRIEFDNNKIFIKDTNDKIFVFDDEGKFLNTIGKIGQGPDEQLNVFGFYLNKKLSIVNVVDIYKSTVFKYSYSGKLLDKKKFDGSLLKNTSSITAIDDRYLMLILDNDNESLFNYGVLDSKNKKRKDYIPYMATGNQSVGFGISKIGKYKETVYMCAFMSDTIYKYDTESKSIIPEWVFKGKLNPVTKKDLDRKNYDLALEALTTAKAKHLSSGIDQLYSTDSYIHFTFVWNDNRYRVFFDTDSKSGCYYKITPTGIYTSLNNLISTTDKAFVCFLLADDVLSENLDGNLELQNIRNNTLEDDNPILAFYYLN